MDYRHQKIEKKWRKYWEEQEIDKVSEDQKIPAKQRRYILDMFPYPSGAGLHVGHPEGYTATDIYARYLRMKGYQVLHPIGFDAFGLPAENYAIKQKVHPLESTLKNIKVFRRQIKSLGFSYDWSREISTADPDYYRWTQWLFLLLYKNGLAYRKKAPVNWCESCQTVLAREQVVDGKCERCQHPVIQKELKQWFFKITDYADRLLDDMDGIDWPEPIKLMQKNWIGRSEGAEIKFKIKSTKYKNKVQSSKFLKVFTTRPDTIFGATYMVVSPEHPLITAIISKAQPDDKEMQSVVKYVEKAKHISEIERSDLTKAKTGIEIKGIEVINPATKETIPIWVADYVLMSYGTGAIMAVPAHDERDFEFAKKYDLPIKFVIAPNVEIDIADSEIAQKIKFEINKYQAKYKSIEVIGDKEKGYKLNAPDLDTLSSFAQKFGLGTTKWFKDKESTFLKHTQECAYVEEGVLENSGKFNGLASNKAQGLITEWLHHEQLGQKSVQYKLRDWLISRQRYWGAPIPIIYCEKCGEVPVPEKNLPVTLPDDVDFRPTGESPLVRSASFHKVKCPKCDGQARRESDTMDTFVCSSWYHFRYADPNNDQEFASKDKINYWLPVDVYVGGAEHAVMHLLYARFICKVLNDQGLVDFKEPFSKLINQGLILADDGRKMSKSLGNVINPDEIVDQYGADTLRMYEMFMGPLEDSKPWSMQGIKGIRRFLERVWSAFNNRNESEQSGSKAKDHTQLRLLHQSIKKITQDIESFKFNTAISQLMILINDMQKDSALSLDHLQVFVKLLAPFAPHLSEELWQMLGGQTSVFKESWPDYDQDLVKEKNIVLIVQVNGKVRDTIEVVADLAEAEILDKARESFKVQKWLQDKKVKKEIVVKNRLVNFVV